MQRKLPQIVITGSLTFDRIMLFNGRFEDVIQPDKLHVLSISILLDELHVLAGGIAGNIAYTLGLLGEKPQVLGSVGPDGQEIIKRLKEVGADTTHIHVSDLPTAVFTAMADKNGCQMGGFYIGAMGDSASLSLKPWQNEDILFVLASHDPAGMDRQAHECVQFGKRMVYDIGAQVVNTDPDLLRYGVDAAELLILNDYEMTMLAKQTGWSETEIVQKVPVTVVTLGEKGSRMTDNRSGKSAQVEVAAVHVPTVIDPTGAGDAFRAGFLYGYVRDWPLQAAAQLGSVTASFAIEQAGGQAHTLPKTQMEERHQQTYNSPTQWEKEY